MSFPEDSNFEPSSDFESTKDSMQADFNRNLGLMIGLPVGFFVLFAVTVSCWLYRRSKRQQKRINQHGPPVSQQAIPQQAYQQPPPMREGHEVDGLGYKTELEAQSGHHELNSHPQSNLMYGGGVVNTGERSEPQEMQANSRQQPPQELPNGNDGRRC
ncbi:hypothetical protein BDW02DRAFT_566214 [Decorospora gaudefroyi]|uniref:Mid2 domain-containing protein n=1 Tax=Decorospora gaudefroyi TaxID=184978 RepID=A0A6A5KPX1_9PLEO|nr:hypothetical protein BDW02DRAFT_566214 [Decorospora gaudefroyi]